MFSKRILEPILPFTDSLEPLVNVVVCLVAAFAAVDLNRGMPNAEPLDKQLL